MKPLTFIGGVHPLHDQHEGKHHTSTKPFQEFAASTVVIPLHQNIGAQCNPVVQANDSVAIGQVIGEATEFVCAPVHASVSGKVIAVEERPTISGNDTLSIVIENDGKDTIHESVKPQGDIESLSAETIREIIQRAGIVGMGGASFPTHVKLTVKPENKIDYFIINGAECEPYLTCDHRLMLERSEDIVIGCLAMMKAVGAREGIIGIEDNKPDAIDTMQKACEGREHIRVQSLLTKYPQGGEKQLIYALTGRKVSEGALPSAVGVVAANASTSAAVADAITKGIPLIKRGCTVTGGVEQPQNLIVRIGTLMQDIIAYAGGFTEEPTCIIAGGPMMGITVDRIDVPIVKGNNGVLVLNAQTDRMYRESNCIRCGRCSEVCPQRLQPNSINAAYLNGNLDRCQEYRAGNCISCGCCTFICPAKRSLALTADLAKKALLARAREQVQAKG